MTDSTSGRDTPDPQVSIAKPVVIDTGTVPRRSIAAAFARMGDYERGFYEMAAEVMAPQIRDDIDIEVLAGRWSGGPYGSSKHRTKQKAPNPNPKAKAQRKARKANRSKRK